MATNLVDRAWMSVSGTPGTGNITLGSVVAGNQSFSDAGVTDGVPFSYVAIDGNDFEIGTGQSASSVTTWQRTTVSRSVVGGTAGTSKLNLSSAAEIFLTARAADLADASLIKTGTIAAARLPAATTGAQGAVTLAAQADQESGAGSKATTPAVQQYHPSAAKAWAFFDSTGTLGLSYNVSSVSRTGTGAYTINFATPFSVASYSVQISVFNTLTGSSAVRVATVQSWATSAAAIQCYNNGGTVVDPNIGTFVSMFGDQ